MQFLARHTVLAAGDNCSDCRTQVLQFFNKTSLVCYDKIVVDDDCLCGSDAPFSKSLTTALNRNREILNGFIEELGAAGFDSRSDLESIPQGYQSKVLHIIAHFLDGFIGIDSAFYNLVEDSHWITSETSALLEENPDRFWLFSLECYSITPKEAALLHK